MTKKHMWFTILGGLVIILVIVLLEVQYQNAVDTCIASGQNEKVCREELR